MIIYGIIKFNHPETMNVQFMKQSEHNKVLVISLLPFHSLLHLQ